MIIKCGVCRDAAVCSVWFVVLVKQGYVMDHLGHLLHKTPDSVPFGNCISD